MLVVFTGTCYLKNLHYSRLELKQVCIAAGVRVGATVTRSTTLLVGGSLLVPINGNAKWERALYYQIPIVTYQHFLTTLGVL